MSEGPYASLNFSIPVGDEPGRVAENIRRAAQALRIAPERLYYLSQVHGREAVVLRGTEARDSVAQLEGDAIVGQNPEAAVGVRIADCLPVLVADRRSGAVAAIHAGWKGLVLGIVESGVRTLRAGIGNDGDLVAAIGPHITARAFEVSEDVATQLAGCSTALDVVERSPGHKPHVVLAKIAVHKLVTLGLDPDLVDVVPGCTHADPSRFFSFRRDGARSGRHLAAIVPRA